MSAETQLWVFSKNGKHNSCESFLVSISGEIPLSQLLNKKFGD